MAPKFRGWAAFFGWSTGWPDIFEWVCALLDLKQFQQAFRAWVGSIIPALGKDQVIAIDGKSSRRTTSKPLHLAGVFATDVDVVLGRTATTKKLKEIKAIPELLDIEGCIVTIAAIGAQTKIAGTISEEIPLH